MNTSAPLTKPFRHESPEETACKFMRVAAGAVANPDAPETSARISFMLAIEHGQTSSALGLISGGPIYGRRILEFYLFRRRGCKAFGA